MTETVSKEDLAVLIDILRIYEKQGQREIVVKVDLLHKLAAEVKVLRFKVGRKKGPTAKP